MFCFCQNYDYNIKRTLNAQRRARGHLAARQVNVLTNVHGSKVPTRWFLEECKFDTRVNIYVKTEEGRSRRKSARGERTCTCDLTKPDRSYGICMKRRACACLGRTFPRSGRPASDLLSGILPGSWGRGCGRGFNLSAHPRRFVPMTEIHLPQHRGRVSARVRVKEREKCLQRYLI